VIPSSHKKFYLGAIFIVLILAIIISLAIVVKFQMPIGSDFALQMKFAKEYLSGENALFGKTATESMAGPYPPLFQLVLAALIRIGLIKPFALLMQAIIYPCLFLVAAWLLLKKKNVVIAGSAAVLMFASRALFDRAQVIPQALDMILFPLAIYFFLEKRMAWFIVLMSIMIYSHGAYAFLLLGGLILVYLWKREEVGERRRKMLVYTLAAALPIIILTMAFLPSMLAFQAQPDVTLNKQVILENPYFLVKLLGWPIVLAGLGSVYYWIKMRKRLDLLDKITLCWLVSLIPLLFVLPDRWPSYATIPFAILGAKTLFGVYKWKAWVAVGLAVLIFIIGFITNYYEAWLLYSGITGYSFQFGT
jgi:hypothetical protein